MEENKRRTFLKVFDSVIEDFYPSFATSVAKVTLMNIKGGKATCLVVIDDLISNFRGTAVMSFYLFTSSHHPQVVTMNFVQVD